MVAFARHAVSAGALGSYIHAVKPLTDFLGNRADKQSWFWFYVTRLFLGAGLAMIFYIYTVLRGGLMTGAQGDAAVNPFGVVVVCGPVGMFADRAAQKLSELFDTCSKRMIHAKISSRPGVRISRPVDCSTARRRMRCDGTRHGS